jgi:hypothetical protein
LQLVKCIGKSVRIIGVMVLTAVVGRMRYFSGNILPVGYKI